MLLALAVHFACTPRRITKSGGIEMEIVSNRTGQQQQQQQCPLRHHHTETHVIWSVLCIVYSNVVSDTTRPKQWTIMLVVVVVMLLQGHHFITIIFARGRLTTASFNQWDFEWTRSERKREMRKAILSYCLILSAGRPKLNLEVTPPPVCVCDWEGRSWLAIAIADYAE